MKSRPSGNSTCTARKWRGTISESRRTIALEASGYVIATTRSARILRYTFVDIWRAKTNYVVPLSPSSLHILLTDTKFFIFGQSVARSTEALIGTESVNAVNRALSTWGRVQFALVNFYKTTTMRCTRKRPFRTHECSPLEAVWRTNNRVDKYRDRILEPRH